MELATRQVDCVIYNFKISVKKKEEGSMYVGCEKLDGSSNAETPL